ncbi:MAG: 1-acyl-sn-glycerol-3-phosphate acyltransferase [Oscillospiraceae bacterium]|nr:1-acyl-sn-glycerol-3-phosphate acyltransferase [Oscillospiraceae bacterium]
MSSDTQPLKQSLWGKFFQGVIKCTAYFLFRPKVIWEDKSVKKMLTGTSAVFVANHTSHFDGAFTGAVLDRYKPYVLVVKRWFEKKGVGTMIKWCRCMPIDLSGADADWYINAENYIKSGGSMIIFPEGGIAREGKMQQFKPGAALLSASTGAVIVPCAIYGEYDMVFGKRQKILIGSPIESRCPKDMRHSKYARQLAQQAEAEVKRLYGKLEKQYGKLPVYEESYSD